MQNNESLLKITLSSSFISLAMVLPYLTGQIPEIGAMLCPMHIPVLLCGFICGWKYGIIVGLITPLMRSVIIGMPPLYPTALCMSVELAVYGFVSGVMYQLLPKKKVCIYISLIIAMLIGRIIWGITMFSVLGFNISKFGLESFWVSGFVNAVPGIILQIILIPLIVVAYNKMIKKESIN